MKSLILVCVCALVVRAAEKPVFEKDASDTKVQVDEARSVGTGRTFDDWRRDIMSFFGYDYDYDYDYFSYVDNDIGFSEHGSSYVSYEPARDDAYDYTDETSWADTMTTAAMVLLPLGLLFSAVPAGVFTFAIRRRSLDDTWFNEIAVDTTSLPLLRAIEATDILEVLPELTTRTCQEKLFCELSRLGKEESGSYMQKAFYYASTLTPKFISRRMGLGRLFDLSKTGNCELIYCSVTREAVENTPEISNNLELPASDVTEQ